MHVSIHMYLTSGVLCCGGSPASPCGRTLGGLGVGGGVISILGTVPQQRLVLQLQYTQTHEGGYCGLDKDMFHLSWRLVSSR